MQQETHATVEDCVAEAVAQERHAQDLRNQQVLQVLKEKDLLIQHLQADQGYLQEQVCNVIQCRHSTVVHGMPFAKHLQCLLPYP